MSIIASTEKGWFVDHKTAIEESFCAVSGNDQNTEEYSICYKCPDAMFNIENQFMMDTQFKAYKIKEERSKNSKLHSQECASVQKETLLFDSSRKKKKKRKRTLNEGETKSAAFHEKIVGILSSALKQLIVLCIKKGALQNMEKEPSSENNLDAREFAKTNVLGDTLVTLCDMGKQIEESNSCLNISHSVRSIQESVVNTMVHYQSDKACIKCILGSDYLIPPRCSFLMSDISCLQPFLDEKKKYDVLVLDPPWQNKSIKRKKTYGSLQDTDLLQLPLQDLCSNECVVVVWVTNKQRQHRFVKEELFPKWNVTYRTHWYWLKVTKYGEPVVPLSDGMKRPYECLIIGTKGDKLSLPEDKVIVSIPCATHSRKPPLHDVLRTVLESYKDIDSCSCLEMFARNLLPGWASWGNEVLLHQHVDCFLRKTNENR